MIPIPWFVHSPWVGAYGYGIPLRTRSHNAAVWPHQFHYTYGRDWAWLRRRKRSRTA